MGNDLWIGIMERRLRMVNLGYTILLSRYYGHMRDRLMDIGTHVLFLQSPT